MSALVSAIVGLPFSRRGRWSCTYCLPYLGQKAPAFRHGEEWLVARRRQLVVLHGDQFFCAFPNACCFGGSPVIDTLLMLQEASGGVSPPPYILGDLTLSGGLGVTTSHPYTV